MTTNELFINMKKTKLEDILIITESDLAGIDEMVYNPVTGNPADEYDKGADSGKIQNRITWPNHNDHLHIGTTNRDVMMKLIDKAQGMGLRSTENPYAKNDPNGKVDKGHATGSFHYKEFQGQPTVGAGVDFSGNQATLREFIRWINANYKGKQAPTDATVEAPEAPKGTTKPSSTSGTTTSSGSSGGSSSGETSGGTNFDIYGGLLNKIDGKGKDGQSILKKVGNDIWDKTMGKVQKALGESTNHKSNNLNEELKRMKKMMDL